MPKLTLQDITSGYATQQQYNDNNRAIEDAIENTLSRDGTTPNQMNADIDMNANDLNNVRDISVSNIVTAQSLILGGVVVSPTNPALFQASAASIVSYTPMNPVLPATTVQSSLDFDYLRNDRDETMTADLTVNNLTVVDDITVGGLVDGVDIATRDADLATLEAAVAALQSDNDEGVFTVSMFADTGTITLSSSFDTLSYIKRGPLVFITGLLRIQSVSSPTGEVRIQSLPFTSSNLTEAAAHTRYAITLENLSSGIGTGNETRGRTFEGNDQIRIFETDGQTEISIASKLQANTDIIVNFCYQTDA